MAKFTGSPGGMRSGGMRSAGPRSVGGVRQVGPQSKGNFGQKSRGYTGASRQLPSRKQKQSKRTKSDTIARRQTEHTFTATVLFCLSVLLVIITVPFSLFFVVKVVPQYLRAVIFRMGRFVDKIKGPGIIFYIPCTDELFYMDLRTDFIDVEPQAVLTKDSVTVYINVVVFFHPINAVESLTMVEDYESAVSYVAQTAVREIFGQKYLHDLLSEKHVLIHLMQETLDAKTTPWGIKIERVEIMDISLPDDMIRSLAAEAEATRRAKAKVIQAEGESKAAEKLKLASEYLAQSEAALQIRYLQTMATVAQGPNTTICFPFPLEFEPLMPKTSKK